MDMVLLRYDGPREAVRVAGHGLHKKGETREYPVERAEELLKKTRHKFVAIEEKKIPEEEDAEAKKGKKKGDR
jgi:hypothetical protein